MTKVKHHVLAILLTLLSCAVNAQFTVQYSFTHSSDTEPSFTRNFPGRAEAIKYIYDLPARLQKLGYLSASVDSILLDSNHANVRIFKGRLYQSARISVNGIDADIIENTELAKRNSVLKLTDYPGVQQEILNYMEETGYPFARVYLDSISMSDDDLSAILKVDRGQLYKIDSIRVYGDIKLNNLFLQRYLDIPAGSVYNKKKLAQVNKKISELIYVEQEHNSDLSLLASGAVLNLYLKQRKNNQVNVLIGLLPNPDNNASKKFQVSGEANVLLRNALGNAETIGFNWQQLQSKSPRLNILFDQPYFLRSAFGLNFSFDMYRKDTTYLNLDLRIGTNYRTGNQQASFFYQRRSTIVNGVNAAQVLFTRKLPEEADVTSNNFGISYDWNNTDYRFNPRRGNEFFITTITGKKTIKKNTQVVELKDPNNPGFNYEKLYDTVKLHSLQFRSAITAAHFFPVGKLATVKTGLNAGWYESGNIFRNELFQLGGYKLLRGFDEESELLSQYAIATIEYRYLLKRNSNFFVFSDAGWGRYRADHFYVSTGAGISFETKAGIFNLAIGLGKKDDAKFNLRQSKLHFGFVSYF